MRKHHYMNRRGSQAGRLAAELRHIASGQATAAVALSGVGAKLVAEALSEKPLPRDYALHSRAPRHARSASGAKYTANLEPCNDDLLGNGERGKESPHASPVVAGNQGDGLEAVAIASETGVSIEHAGSEDGGKSGLDLPRIAAAVGAAAAGVAIEFAAGEEEKAAASRIQLFLRRRRRQGRSLVAYVTPSEEGATPPPSEIVAIVEPSGGEDSSATSTGDWFRVALRVLRREVDIYLRGEEVHDGVSGGTHPVATDESPPPLLSCDDTRILENGQGNPAGHGAPDDGVEGIQEDTEEPSGDDHQQTSSESSEAYESDWPTLPPVPLRARAPSLYTLPLPGGGFRKREATDSGSDLVEGAEAGSTSPTIDTRGDIFTKLDPAVAARLSTATSIFSLRAADILTAFSPPTAAASSSRPIDTPTALPIEKSSGARPSTVPGTVGERSRSFSIRRSSCANLSSPEALRRRLRAEAEHASRAGVGRPWLLAPHKTRTPTRHRLQQQQRSAFLRGEEKARAAHGRVGRCSGFKHERGEKKRRREDFFGPWTPLGRRLARRFNAGRAARRRCILGETDAFRAKQVGRRMRSGAASDALEKVERALDLRLCLSREKKIPPAHLSALLDVVGRFVFSDSQVYKWV